jgi:hypothetical protein
VLRPVVGHFHELAGAYGLHCPKRTGRKVLDRLRRGLVVAGLMIGWVAQLGRRARGTSGRSVGSPRAVAGWWRLPGGTPCGGRQPWWSSRVLVPAWRAGVSAMCSGCAGAHGR